MESEMMISEEEKAELRRIENMFRGRCVEQGVKWDSKKFYQVQAEFFAGAMTALNKTIPSWTIFIMSGRPIVKY